MASKHKAKGQAVTRLSSRQFTAALKRGELSARQITAYQRKAGGVLSEAQRRVIGERQRAAKAAKRQRVEAREAVRHYRPKKSERGKIVFVGTKGGANPQSKRRKGYPVYITSTGKKRLLRQKSREPYKPRRAKEIQLPGSKNLRRKKEAFERARLEVTARGKSVVRKSGAVKTGGAWDFNKAIKPIARSLKQAIEGQASQRSFLVSVVALMRDSSGTFPVEFDVPIDKADHISIAQGGLENFVRLKLYAFMAQQLAYAGYITAGSANHIRRSLGLPAGAEVGEEEWEQYHAEQGRSFSWQSPRFEVARIERLEWKIQQAK